MRESASERAYLPVAQLAATRAINTPGRRRETDALCSDVQRSERERERAGESGRESERPGKLNTRLISVSVQPGDAVFALRNPPPGRAITINLRQEHGRVIA